MKYNEINFNEFDATKALQGVSLCEVKKEGEKFVFCYYVLDFKKITSSDVNIQYSGIDSINKETQYYDIDGVNIKHTFRSLRIATSKINVTDDTTAGTRADPATGTSYKISSLLPKDQIAMNVLNAMLTHISIDKLQTMPDVVINRISELSYIFAQSMINTSALYRKELGKTTTTGEGESQETTTTSDDKSQQSLKDIASAVNSLSDEKKGLVLTSSETKPINVKLTGSSSSGGGEMTGDIVMSTAEGKPIETKIANTLMVRNPTNDAIEIIVNSQTQADKGAIPIKIDGGAIGQEFRNHDNTVKQMPAIVKFANDACTLSYDSNSKTLTITIAKASALNDGLLSASVMKDITDLVNLVGLDDFIVGSSTYPTIQDALTALNNRIEALENK